MDLFSIILITHIIGAVLVLGGATFIEVFLNKSLRDGEIDPIEQSFMKTTISVLRVGLFISVFSGLGLILVYRINDQIFRLYDPLLWAKFTILFIVLVNTLFMLTRQIKLKYGSAISFISWYFVFILGFLASGPPYPYTLVMMYYVITLVIGYFVLQGIRRMLGIKL